MCGLLIHKQMYDLSDVQTVEQWLMTPYFHVFCGEKEFQIKPPCDASELSVFRKRIGPKGVEKIFALSVELHGDDAEEETVYVDSTVQEKPLLILQIPSLPLASSIGLTNLQKRVEYNKEERLLRKLSN